MKQFTASGTRHITESIEAADVHTAAILFEAIHGQLPEYVEHDDATVEIIGRCEGCSIVVHELDRYLVDDEALVFCRKCYPKPEGVR